MKKVFISFMTLASGIFIGGIGVAKYMHKRIYVEQKDSAKHLSLFLMMNQWVKIKQKGKNLTSYFEKNGYKRIAVYGMSYAGETFLEELNGTLIDVAYGIDRNAKNIYSGIDVFTIEDSLDKVDIIVVTAITFFDEIKEELCKKVDCPIISLEDILYEV